ELLAAGEGTEELARRVQQLREAVDEAVMDSRLLVELDRILLEQSAVMRRVYKDGAYQYDQARTLPMYAEVLRNYGVDLAAPAAAGARVRASRLRLELLAALADWRMITPDKAERQQLEEVIEAADPPEAMRAPWRLHAAALREDLAEVARGVRELIELAKEPSVQQLPVAVVVHLAHDLGICKQWPAAELLLRAALARKPGDFWLNHNL